jgi:hypothetical protein
MSDPANPAPPSADQTIEPAKAPDPAAVQPAPDQPTEGPPAEASVPLPFAVGDRVRGVAAGGILWGVRHTPEGAFVQFFADGPWLPAAGFERVEGD